MPKKCKCNHPKIELNASLLADGNKSYYAVCIKCKKEVDVITWLVSKITGLLGR